MALGVTAFSEAPFASEDANVIAYPQGNVLTSSMGEESNTGAANVTVTGNQATMSNGGAVAGSSVLVSVTGSQLSSSIGDETAGIGVELTGIGLSISNKTFTQDTLTAFGEAPLMYQVLLLRELQVQELFQVSYYKLLLERKLLQQMQMFQ